MKKLLAIAAVAMGLSIAIAGAQGPGRGPGGPGGMGRFDPARMEQMRKQMRDEAIKTCKMTPDQVKKYDVILKKGGDEMKALFQKSGGNFQAMRPQMQALRAKQEKEIEKILKPDQFAKYKKLQEERRARMRGGFGGGRPGGGRPGGGPG